MPTNKELFIQHVTDKIHRDGISDLMDYLENRTDFYISPASTRYHGAYEGGLLEHSLNVMERLSELYRNGTLDKGETSDTDFQELVANTDEV